MSLIGPPVLALAAALVLTPVAIRIARGMGWIAAPTEDRWHRAPTALGGGIAIFAAVSLGWVFLPLHGPLLPIWLGGALLAATGFIDDRWGVSLVAKLGVQLGGAAVLIWSGLLIVPALPLWVSLPLTLLWVIGITNAVNLLDNMDGLAAGISAIAALTLAALALGNGDAITGAGALVLAAAAAGFLVYNFNPARTFMGDCGSLFLGFTLSGFALTVPSTGSGRGLTALLLVPAAVMAVPIFDTTLVTMKRLLVGRSVGQGGRDHSSHRLVALGLTERGAVLTLYAVAAGFGTIAIALQRIEVGFSLSLFIYAAVALAAFGAFLAAVRVYDPDTEEQGRLRADGLARGDNVLLRAAFRHKRVLVGACVDILLVAASFLAAFYLRYDGTPPEAVLAAITRALPAVVLVKLVVFQLFGLYRGMWWHAGTPEVLRVVGASVMASFASVVVLGLSFGLEGLARSALIMDAVLATLAIAGVRLSFRFFRRVRSLFFRRPAEAVLIVGTGPEAIRVLYQTLESESPVRPVGFVDGGNGGSGATLYGLPILSFESVAAMVVSGRLSESTRLAEPSAEGGYSTLPLSLSGNGAVEPSSATLMPSTVEARDLRRLGAQPGGG